MKYLVSMLAVAVLCTVGCSPSEETTTESSSTGPSATTVSLEVPSMSCPVACWPTVKKTLEAEPGVASVTLSEQKEEDIIDNHVVYVAVEDGFDVDHAIGSLAAAGFDDAKLEN